MEKIEWKPKGSHRDVSAIIDGCLLYCNVFTSCSEELRWSAEVGIGGCWRYGPMRYSLAKAKEDCVRLIRKLLIDYRESLRVELKNFDLEME